ncbi:MAG: hypothetical protein PHE58_08065, partial [Candidatus Omnitrophica bacterium]|nr:hypothetical protein [Candidatus Omnitrophota bacterium]
MRFLIIVCMSLVLFSPAYAGWEGKFRCDSCGYESEALRVDCGTHSCYSVLYCDACKDFYSVLVSYDEAVIRKEYKPADADKTIKEFRKNLVKPLNEVFSE